MIPDEVIEQVRDAADLVTVIGETVALKKTGSDWRGPCPFHGGTGRNFAVIPRKAMFYCFVCHEAGDIFTWYMKRAGLDYPSAVREVARKVGIVIPERVEREGPDPREPLFAAVAVAQGWFARQLHEHAEADAARRYLESRDIPLERAAELGLGYATRGREFLEEMGRLGIAEAILLEAGLLVKRDDGTIYPRFRTRLLFPIHDLRGRVVAFGGRLLGPGEPKYLNSPESPIYHKGSILYNLHAARPAIRQAGSALLVEGYFDVQRLVLAGVDHVVAPLGTALTPEQAVLLKRFAPSATLLYDSDAAGLRATFRAGDELLRHGVRVRVATMPDGEDPDSLVRTGGAAALEPILHDAVDVLERKLQLLERKGWLEGVEHRRDALDRLLPTVRAASDPITRDLYIGTIADRLRLSRDVLEREVNAAPPEPLRPAAAPERRGPAASAPRPVRGRAAPPGARTEATVLRAILADRTWLGRARELVPEELFEVAAYRAIYQGLLELPDRAPVSDLASRLDPAASDALTRLQGSLDGREGYRWDEEFIAAVERLQHRARQRDIDKITDPTERAMRLRERSSSADLGRRLLKTAAPLRRPPARPSRADPPPEE
jgi:DNA primase